MTDYSDTPSGNSGSSITFDPAAYPHKFSPDGTPLLARCRECGDGPANPRHVPIGECDVCFEPLWNPAGMGATCVNAIRPGAVPCPGKFVPRGAR